MTVQRSEEIYDSAQRREPLLEEFFSLLKYRDLVFQFVSRSIKTRYKRSVLGVAWTLLNPLLTMLVMTIVFSNFFRFDIPHYPVYVLSGILIWNFFSGTTTSAMVDMASSGALLGRIYMPKSVFAVSAVGTGLFNLVISLVPLFAIALLTGAPLRPSILVMPLAILILAVFSLGLGLILSAAAVFFADMVPVYQVVLMAWFYATPVFYPESLLLERQPWLLYINPMYYMVSIFRAPLFEGRIPEPYIWALAAGIALLVFVLGGLIFTRKSNEYAYRI